MPLRRVRNRLREIRKQKGLSAFDLQLLSHTPAWRVYLIERGLGEPRIFERYTLARALDVEEEEIFPEAMSKSQEIVRYSRRTGSGGRGANG